MIKIPATFEPTRCKLASQFFALSAICFLASGLIGMVGAIFVGAPSSKIDWISHIRFDVIRPLHTMLSLVAMISGGLGINQSIIRAHYTKHSNNPAIIALTSLLLFVAAAVISLSMGMTSGREYISWISPLNWLIVVACLPLTFSVFVHRPALEETSPEGFWLLGLGWLLVIFGLIETQGFQIAWVFENNVKDLTQQWHGIDTIIAGINVLLYGGMIFLLQQKPKKLRKRLLFAIAGFGLLGTFGHHHYISPQPGYLKVFAFLASMVAILSFLRHIRGYHKEISTNKTTPHPIMPLLLSAELWTIVAVGSGVLFAIPQINFFVHGTYLIVVHAMGSMIGINLMIVVAASLVFMGYNRQASEKAIKWGVWLVNGSLAALWIGLAIPSVTKGISRTRESYQQFFSSIEPWMVIFPVFGLTLLCGIYLLLSEVIWCCFHRTVPQGQTENE